jgi:hypothetical protein
MSGPPGRPGGSVYTRRSDSILERGRTPAGHGDPARESRRGASTSMRLATTREGGFRIDPGGGAAELVAVPAGEGWEVRRGAAEARFRLLRDRSYPGGFVLRDGAGDESGRTTRETDGETLPANLLAPDGRLFRVRRRIADVPRFELSGWEVPGAYLLAYPDGEQFAIERTDAGTELPVAEEILILFAAEILDAVADEARD